jgi:hypothetical protein
MFEIFLREDFLDIFLRHDYEQLFAPDSNRQNRQLLNMRKDNKVYSNSPNKNRLKDRYLAEEE